MPLTIEQDEYLQWLKVTAEHYGGKAVLFALKSHHARDAEYAAVFARMAGHFGRRYWTLIELHNSRLYVPDEN